jgi:hypothetical protein
MKRTHFWKMALIGLIAVTTICSCNKENDNGDGNDNGVIKNNVITAVVDSGASYNAIIDSVKASVYFANSDDSYVAIARAPYVNGGFTLTLPASLNNQYLRLFSQNFSSSGITISDANAMGTLTSLQAYKTNENGQERLTGAFYYLVNDWKSTWMYYADRDVNITGSQTDYYGSYTYTKKYDLHLKKGWNMCYVKNTENIDENTHEIESEITTQTPQGVGKWYFDD